MIAHISDPKGGAENPVVGAATPYVQSDQAIEGKLELEGKIKRTPGYEGLYYDVESGSVMVDEALKRE